MNYPVKGVAGRRIFVGLSGGVDSAVTAALLKESGAQVIGVFIKGWYPPGFPCTWSEDRRDAMRVAARLGIPFHTLDASKEYKQSVIDYLIREYGAGRTPNPDVMCNRDVKFGAFYRYAKEHDADFIATGHYAQLEHREETKHAAPRAIRCEVERSRGMPAPLPHVSSLLRGIDSAKDQSYFLWAVPKDALASALFPLGALRKSEVRTLAKKFKLPVAEKKDSQGICFLGNVSMKDFLASELGLASGPAYDEEGTRIGTHDGALAYTVGERVSLTEASPGPWYVSAKRLTDNTLVVAHTPQIERASREIVLADTNWISDIPVGRTLSAQYRYHGPVIRGTLSARRDEFVPAEPLSEALAAGQSLVIYDRDNLLGGGIIA